MPEPVTPTVPRWEDVAPRRVLTLSADMGGGHDATAAALEEAARGLWPGTETRRLDTLDVMGPGIGRLFRRIYVANVESTPRLYELFYSALWRRRWFASASKRLTGSWSGRRLVRHLDRFDPDLILSTYPLGSAGLAWLHRHRGLGTTTAAYVSDFAPHPFWIHPELDANFVMHPAAVPLAHAADARATVRVCAPPVVSKFAPGDRARARRELGLREDGFVVLVSCGAYAFGRVDETVRALLRASPDVQVVAACGRDEQTRRCLEAMGEPADRLVALGWTDAMASYMQACDLVLSNAGGATALEALASGRPVLMSRPIAAHGSANADLMVVAGVADLCAGEEELVAYVAAAVRDRESLAALEQRAQEHVARHDLHSGLRSLGDLRQPRGTGERRPADLPPAPARHGNRLWPVRAQDSFFDHVEHGDVLQEVGAVLELDDVAPGRPLDAAEAERLVAARLPGLPPLYRRLVPGRRGGWATGPVHLPDHVQETWVGDAPDPREAAQQAVDRFWSVPMERDRPGWRMHIVHTPQGQPTLLALKMHHVYGDGISALGLFDRFLTAEPGDPLRERTWISSGARPSPVAEARRTAGRAARGLVSLAAGARHPRQPLNRPIRGLDRQLVMCSLGEGTLRRLSRQHRAHAHEVALTLVAEALAGALVPRGLLDPAVPLRVMVPVAMRPARLDRVFGNWTGSLALDLPVGAMPFADRLAAVKDQIRVRGERGEPEAAQAVMLAAGLLPRALHAKVARLVYSRRFFSSIVSYMPAARGARWFAGARVRAMYPVLPLADAVPLTVGLIVADRVAGVGVFMDARLGVPRSDLAEAFAQAVARAEGGAG